MDFNFVEIPASEVESARGHRRAKYKHKVWEHDNDPKAYQRYVMALANNNARHQRVAFGSYIEDDNPFVALLDEKLSYEIEMETVFMSDLGALVPGHVSPSVLIEYSYYDEDEEEMVTEEWNVLPRITPEYRALIKECEL